MYTSALQVPLFKGIQIQDKSLFLSMFSEKKYQRKQVIFFQGDNGDEMYIIKNGAVKIFREDDGRQIILGHQFPGETIGELEALHHDNRRLASAATIENTTMWMIKKPDLEELVAAYPIVLRRIFLIISERLRQADRQIEYLAFLDSRARVANLLLDLYSNFRIEIKEGHLIKWKPTHQHLANMIGIGRESVTRTLRELQQSGIISMRNKQILITNLPDLKKLARQPYDSIEMRRWHSTNKYITIDL